MSHGRALLVIGPSWIGDIVMAQCLYAALARDRPDIAIDVVGPATARPLVERMKQVRGFIASPVDHGEFSLRRRLEFGRKLKGRYAEAYVLPGSWKSALIPCFAGIPRRCGYLREWRWGLLNDVRHFPPGLKRKTARIFQGLADPAVLGDASRLLPPRLEIDERNQARLLRSLSLSPQGFVCLCPGAEFGPAKRWPPAHWAGLAREFSREGLRPVVLGSAKEHSLADEICANADAAINLAGETSLADVVDLVAASRLVVANDSGLMHVASAAGSSVLALYGSTSADDTPPLSPNARVLSLGLGCSPCNKRQCPLLHHDCMQKLSVGRVMSEALTLMSD